MSSNINEKNFSHIPAVKTLISLGYTLLNQEDLKKERGNSYNILLKNILAKEILKLNKNTRNCFDLNDAKEAVRQLTNIEASGLIKTNQKIYDLLIFGTTIEKDFRDYSLKYIDWQKPENNSYQVTFEMILDSITGKTRKCDIVLFVNGIPFVVIECKSPLESLDQAISQHIRNQRSNEIPHFFYYTQLLIAINKNEAKYATVGSSKDHWSVWKEEEKQNINIINNLINIPLLEKEKNNLYTGAFANCRHYFDTQESDGTIEPTEQDKILYALCRPKRLLDLVKNFCVFDNSVRKIARHHQFFATYATIERIKQRDETEIRKGGVIWHTQGTGKSLTMVMIAKFLLQSANLKNPRIVIITDRIELDGQIENTFKACGLEPKLASSSAELIKLINEDVSIITTVINKFKIAFDNNCQDLNDNIFTFIDEGHRTQYGDLADKMRVILPKACHIAFTGTPLLNEQKNTFKKFGDLIHEYTTQNALKDNMIIPLFYEGRIIQQYIENISLLDKYFDTITNGLDKEKITALKKKFSRSNMLSNTKEAIYAKAFDISTHYVKTFKNTGLKGMLIAPSRSIAIRFKKILDEIDQVRSEVVISSFDDREGYETLESKNEINEFLAGLQTKYEKEFNSNIIRKFKSADDPEILIVVSKLLTGFDAPRVAVVYICKNLKEHNLLQAIARANRLFNEKDKAKEYGYIIDYEGLDVELKHARQLYESDKLKNFNKEDLEDTIFFVDDKIEELFPLLQKIKDIFINVPNNSDFEQLEQYLTNKVIRNNFYSLLDKFKNLMSIASNSNKLSQVFSNEQLTELKNGLKEFSKLKEMVEKRYNEKPNKKIYTDQITKLLDEHVVVNDITKTEPVNIFSDEIFKNIIERTDKTILEEANQINAEIQDILNDYIRIDPAFFQKFSELIHNTLAQHYSKRLSDINFLNKLKEIRTELKNNIPSELGNNKTKFAFYRKSLSFLQGRIDQNQNKIAIKIALDAYKIIKGEIIVHWTTNSKVLNKMKSLIDHYFYDVVRNEMKINFNPEDLNEIVESLIDFAKEHEDE